MAWWDLRRFFKKKEKPVVRKEPFELAFDYILLIEGGYVNDPNDRGGETKFGISKKTYPDLDIKNLTIDQAKQIYFTNYWMAAGCDKLPWPLSLIIFDAAVHHNVIRAKRFLNDFTGDYKALLDKRRLHYKRIIAKIPSQKKYERGWDNRITRLQQFIENNP